MKVELFGGGGSSNQFWNGKLIKLKLSTSILIYFLHFLFSKQFF